MSEREKKVDEIFAVINHLTDEEKRELTIRARTTTEGIKAYTSFLYGVTTSSNEIPPKEDPHCEDKLHQEGEGTKNTGASESSSSGTKDSEEWL